MAHVTGAGTLRPGGVERTARADRRQSRRADRFDRYLDDLRSGSGSDTARVPDEPSSRPQADDDRTVRTDDGTAPPTPPPAHLELIPPSVATPTEDRSAPAQAQDSGATSTVGSAPTTASAGTLPPSFPASIPRPGAGTDSQKSSLTGTSSTEAILAVDAVPVAPTSIDSTVTADAAPDTGITTTGDQPSTTPSEQPLAGSADAQDLPGRNVAAGQNTSTAAAPSEPVAAQAGEAAVADTATAPDARGRQAPADASEPVAAGDTVFDRMVRKVEEQVTEQASRTQDRRRSRDSAVKGEAASVRPSVRVQHSGSDPLSSQTRSSIGADPAELSATSGSRLGDGLAARIGRFLIGSTDVAGVDATAVAPQGTAAGPPASSRLITPTTGVSGAGPAGHTFSRILAAGADGADAIDGTARLLHAAGGQGRYQATLQLEPPELGQLRVQLRMHHQAMTLRVDADNAAAGRLIGTHMSDLRDALAIHGIRVDRADVVVRSESPGQAGAHTQYGGGSTGGDDNPSGSATSDWNDGGGRTDGGPQDQRRSGGRSADRPENAEQPARLAAGQRTVERVGDGMTSAAELSLDLVA